eukprot:gene11012-12833_t
MATTFSFTLNTNSMTSSGGNGGTQLNTSGSRETLVQHLHSSFYKNVDTHSSGSLYSKDDEEDDDSMFYDALDVNPAWTPPLTPNNLAPLSPRFHTTMGIALRRSHERLSPLQPSPIPTPSPLSQHTSVTPPSQAQTHLLAKAEALTVSPPSSLKETSPIATINNNNTSSNTSSSSSSSASETSTSPSSSPSTSPSSSPSLSSLSLTHVSSSGTIKAKRNSKVLNLIKNKKEGFHNLFKGDSHHIPATTQQQQQQPLSSTTTVNIPTTNQSTSHQSSISQSDSSVFSNSTSQPETGEITVSTDQLPSGANPLSASVGVDKQERRVSRWLKSLSTSNLPAGLKKKSKEECTGFSLVQTIKGHKGSIWSIELSKDGSMMASGGSDGLISIWSVNPSNNDVDNCFFKAAPKVTLAGHEGHILDIKWISKNRLLSSSTDTVVKMWNTESGECLRTFEHNDIVVSLSLDISQSLFFSATLDGVVRKWSFAQSDPTSEIEVGEFITTVSLSTNPSLVIVTTHLGNILIYNPVDMELITKFNASENHTGKKGRGPKIVGATLVSNPTECDSLLISSNDSSIRQYSLKDFKRICKYKGMEIETHQVKPSVSHDKKTIMIGSEDHNIYIYDNLAEHPLFTDEFRNHKLNIESCEYIPALNKPVTSTIFIPSGNDQVNNYFVASDTAGHIMVFKRK